MAPQRRRAAQLLLLGLAAAAVASPAVAARSLQQFGKGKGAIGMVTQSVAVAAPINVGPVVPAGLAMAPVYTGAGVALGASAAPLAIGPTFVPGPVRFFVFALLLVRSLLLLFCCTA